MESLRNEPAAPTQQHGAEHALDVLLATVPFVGRDEFGKVGG
jgi:hypothetical protein